jgi:hypothetical protein
MDWPFLISTSVFSNFYKAKWRSSWAKKNQIQIVPGVDENITNASCSRWSIPSLPVEHTREAILICVAISYEYLSFLNHP